MVKKSDLFEPDPEEKDPAGNGGGQQSKARKKTIFSYKEGDEVEGITEETEDALKPEERSPREVLQHFAQYPIIAAIASFLIVLLALWLPWGFGRAIIAALAVALVAGAVVLVAVIKWIKIIPSDPPFIGAITVGERVTKWVAPAGYFLTVPYLLDVIPMDTRRVDQDFVIQNIATRDRAFVGVAGHASYQVDPKRLPMAIKSGKIIIDKTGKLVITGIPSIFDNMYLQYQRAEINKLDIEPALGASETLTNNISKHFTGQENFDIDDMSRNGRSDVRGLGIIIFIVNVTSVLPSGETKKALEREVIEKFERKGEVYEVVTRVRQALADIFATRGLDITEMTQEQIKIELSNIRKEDPEKFDETIKSLKTAYIEYEMARKSPGSIIPGMRERLIQKGGGNSIPWDVIGANFADMLKKPGQAETVKKTETEKSDNKKKGKGKGKGKKEELEKTEEEEEYEYE